MGLNLAACVNKSGKSVNVYSQMNGYGSIIGQIVRNEVFVLYGEEGSGISVYFKTPSGRCDSGYLDGSIDLPNGLFDRIIDYPYRKLNGYYIFKLRRSAKVLDRNGNYETTLSGGTAVACNSATVGADNPGYKHIVGIVKNGSIDRNLNGCFVDMGFSYGSSGKTMTLYGNY